MSRISEQVACASKRFFPDKRAAVSAMKVAMKKRGRHGRAEALRAYACGNCGGWHHTKKMEEK